jgi:hypothetical protein
MVMSSHHSRKAMISTNIFLGNLRPPSFHVPGARAPRFDPATTTEKTLVCTISAQESPLMKSTRALFAGAALAALLSPAYSKDSSKKEAGPDPAAQSSLSKEMAENLKFSLADKEADKDQTVSLIYAVFWTNDDDKGAGDGITETYTLGGQTIAQSKSWGQAFKLKEHTAVIGKQTDVSANKIAAQKIGDLGYKLQMDTDDEWNVVVWIYAKLANGHVYLVGQQYLQTSAKAKTAEIKLGW